MKKNEDGGEKTLRKKRNSEKKNSTSGGNTRSDERTDAYSPVQLEEADCANSRSFVPSLVYIRVSLYLLVAP